MLHKILACATGVLACICLAGCSSLPLLGDSTAFVGSARPSSQSAADQEPSVRAVPTELIIGHDRGGFMENYALRMMRLRDNGTSLRFTGRCESACTVFLALPADKTCIAPGASFSFHAPRGPSRAANERAVAFLHHSYPVWVRNWIASKGGLTNKVITLRYDEASQYMRTCDSAAA